ncbi:MAG: hypothetical protein V8R92_10575 [Eubacterium sp.]
MFPFKYIELPNAAKTREIIKIVSNPLLIIVVFFIINNPIIAKNIPIRRPKSIWKKIINGIDDKDLELTKDIPMIVSIYDTGSLLPLSISRRDAVPFFKFNFFFLNIEKTLAASVEERTEPIRKLSKKEKFSRK